MKSGVIVRKEIKKQPCETVVDLMRHVTFWVSCGGVTSGESLGHCAHTSGLWKDVTDRDGDFGAVQFRDRNSEAGVFMTLASVACEGIKGARSCRAFPEGPWNFLGPG